MANQLTPQELEEFEFRLRLEQEQSAAPTQQPAKPRKIGIGDVAFGLRPHIMRAVEPKIQQATAGLSQRRILPELPASTPDLLVSPIGKAVYGAVQQTSSPQEFAKFALRSAADPLTYAAGPIIKASTGPVLNVASKTVGAISKPFKALARTAPEAFEIWKAGGNMTGSKVGGFRDKVVSSINKTMREAGEQFGSTIDDLSNKSTTPVDLNSYAQDVADEMIENPKIASIVRRTPGLSDLLKLQDKKLSLKESQELFKMIGSKLKIASGQIDFETRQAIETLRNGLRNAQIESLSDDALKEEFRIARETWSRVKTDYDTIRKQFTPASFENTVKTMFGDRKLYQEAMNRLSPKDLLEISRTSKAVKIGKAAKATALTAVGGGILGAGAKIGSSLLD